MPLIAEHFAEGVSGLVQIDSVSRPRSLQRRGTLGCRWDDVYVGVRHLETGDDHHGSRNAERNFLCLTDYLRYPHDVVEDARLQVRPFVDRLARDDEDVSASHRFDRQDRDASIVGPHKPSGNLAINNHFENSAHGDIVPH